MIKCRFKNPDCDKVMVTCDDCKVIVDFIEDLENNPNKPDMWNVPGTWLGDAYELLKQIASIDYGKTLKAASITEFKNACAFCKEEDGKPDPDCIDCEAANQESTLKSSGKTLN